MRRVVAYRLRADARHRWRSLVGLALLVAVLGGIVLALVAGARRTSSAYERLAERINPPELLVSPALEADDADPDVFYDAVRRIDGVRDVSVIGGIYAVPEEGTATERLSDVALSGAGVVASVDGGAGYSIGRYLVVDGRMPQVDRADEVLVSERFAGLNDVEVGDRLDFVLLTADDGELDRAPADAGTPASVTVTGIGVSYDEVIPLSELNAGGTIFATPPFAALSERPDWNYEGGFVDVDPGADVADVIAEVEALVAANPDLVGGDVFISDQQAQTEVVSDAFRPIAIALGVSAAAVGAIALVVVGQAISRSNRATAAEADALLAAGLRPRDRVAFDLARAFVAGIIGAAGAVVVAYALSSRFPVGVARTAEPSPGFDADPVVLLGGAIALALVATLASLPGALRSQRRRPTSARVPVVAGSLAVLPPPAAQGARFALVDRGARPLPARSTLVVGTVAVAAVLAAATFAVSLNALVGTPVRYGQGWDRLVDGQFGPIPIQPILDELGDHPAVDGIAVGDYGEVVVDGRTVPAISLTSLTGEVSVTLEEGHPPRHAGEIVLGGAEMDALDLQVGDEVSTMVGGEVHTMEVTGRGVFPRMGQGSFTTTGLGVGALVSAELPLGVAFFAPEDLPPEYIIDDRLYTFAAIDVGGDPAAVDASLETIVGDAIAQGAFIGVRQELVPTKVQDLERIESVPVATAGLLAVVAVAALTHLLVVAVRERRHELAILRTVGFTRRQLRSTVGWHAASVVAVALVVGIPVGLAVGRLVWRWFEDDLYAASPAVVPWAWIALAFPVGMVIAQLVAAIPGSQAARTRPAVVFREE